MENERKASREGRQVRERSWGPNGKHRERWRDGFD